MAVDINKTFYKYSLGLDVWHISEVARAQDKCSHCNSWINYKPEYKIEKVKVIRIEITLYPDSVSVLYDLSNEHGQMVASCVWESTIFATEDEAKNMIAIMEHKQLTEDEAKNMITILEHKQNY